MEAELGPIDILVANTGGPPKGGRARQLDRGVGRGLPLARARGAGAGRCGAAGDAGARLGADRQRRLQLDRRADPPLTLSNAVRQAAVGFLKTLSREVAADGITVNTVVTGKFATDRLAENEGSLENAERSARETVPARRLGLPEEFGDLVAFLASDRAAYITGTTIPIDGGLLKSV